MALREDMLEMLDSTRVEETCAIDGQIGIIVSFGRMNNSNVYIVAENDLHTYIRLFKSWDLNVHKVVCSQPKEFRRVDDADIVSPESLLTDDTPRKLFVIFPDISEETRNFFDTKYYNIPSVEKPNYTSSVTPSNAQSLNLNSVDEFDKFDANRMFYYQSHKRELMELFDSLADETSKRALFYYVESYVRNVVYRGEQIPTLWKYFFGGKYERIYKHLDGEVWINCGANVGDTVFQYLNYDFRPKRILAFEGSKKIFDTLSKNLAMLPPEKRALVEPINEMIDETTNFEKILAGDKCTLLNADIEGAELSLLRSMEKIIRADRPVIAICVYHFKEDLLAIPQFLQSVCTNYVYYLRKYTSYYKRFKNTGEMVLYAVPIERSIITPPVS